MRPCFRIFLLALAFTFATSTFCIAQPTVTPQPAFTSKPKIPPTQTPKPADIPPTELHLRLINSEGESVPFSKAELLLDAWNQTGVFPLETNGDLLILPLEEEIAQKLWLNEFSQQIGSHSYFLYLEADGYAPVRSEEVYFIGMETWNGGLVDHVFVGFYDGPKVTISKGQTKEIELVLRKTESRYLHFVDDTQQPVAGVKVLSYMFWSASNHCGYPAGANLIAENISDKKGRVSIPDGDFEYLLQFEKPLYHLKEPTSFFPMQMVTYLSDQQTVIELHKLKQQQLEMVVQKGEKPQVGRILYGQSIGCPCGLCEQKLGTTDDLGRVSLAEFYPEEWAFIFFCKENRIGSGFAWEADPKKFSRTEVIKVELSE